MCSLSFLFPLAAATSLNVTVGVLGLRALPIFFPKMVAVI